MTEVILTLELPEGRYIFDRANNRLYVSGDLWVRLQDEGYEVVGKEERDEWKN